MLQERKWIGLKDVILVTLLSAVWIAVSFVVMIPFSTNLNLAMAVGPGAALIISGITYTLMCAKAPRHGTLLLFCVIEGIYNYISVGLILVSVINILVGAVMELIMFKDGYRKRIRLMIAYAVFGVGWIMAPAVSVLSTRASTEATLLASGFTQEYVDSCFALYSAGNLALSAVIVAVASVIGVLLGYKLLKKHFIPAGVVEDDE